MIDSIKKFFRHQRGLMRGTEKNTGITLKVFNIIGPLLMIGWAAFTVWLLDVVINSSLPLFFICTYYVCEMDGVIPFVPMTIIAANMNCYYDALQPK